MSRSSVREAVSLVACVSVGLALAPVVAVLDAVARARGSRPRGSRPRELSRWAAAHYLTGGDR